MLEYFIETVLVYENSRDATVPNISSLKLPSRQQQLMQMGTATDEMRELKSNRKEHKKTMKALANKEILPRSLQPEHVPKRDESMVGKKIEVLFETEEDDDGSTTLEWFVGEVVVVYGGSKDKDKVLIHWDDTDIDNSIEVLSNTKFNKEGKAEAWRMHVPATMEETNNNSESDDETSVEEYSDIDSDSNSENENDAQDEDSFFDDELDYNDDDDE